jgi:hypothetical protein
LKPEGNGKWPIQLLERWRGRRRSGINACIVQDSPRRWALCSSEAFTGTSAFQLNVEAYFSKINNWLFCFTVQPFASFRSVVVINIAHILISLIIVPAMDRTIKLICVVISTFKID